ncbi:MAG: hypothetical protein LWW77_05525 [Propionibacteriales bacterium]|nr:hypothetical protein [Propionibacteriales bacterium]
MPLFSRRRFPSELAAVIGRSRVLAQSDSEDAPVVGLADRLVYPTADGWASVAWHEIERGGWDPSTRKLHWTRVDGLRAEVALDEPGRIAQLFQERVNATVVYTQQVTFGGRHSVVISARRSLADLTAPLSWHLTPGESTTADQVRASAEVAAVLQRLQRDFGLS